MFLDLLIILFISMPLAALVWFIVSLVLFLTTPMGDPRRRSRGVRLIVSGSLALFLIGAIATIVILFFLGLRGM